MKSVCVYHSVDLDGYMSGAIVKHWFNTQEVPNKDGEYCNTMDFIGYNYGKDIPDLSNYDRVIMCDLSFPKEEMIKLHQSKTSIKGYLGEGREKYSTNFIWLDHHISAIKNMEDYEHAIFGLRNTEYAACELTWMYFFHNTPMPEMVRLLGRYDSFQHKGTDEELYVLEFQYGARQFITDVESAYEELLNVLRTPYENDFLVVQDIHAKGEIIYQYLCAEAKLSYKNGFPIYFKQNGGLTGQQITEHDIPLKFICINRERFNPINFGINYHDDGYDGCATFHYDGNKWCFSLYNDNGKVDCSIIAKQFSGGGHKSASGFVISNITQIIK